MSVYVEDDDMIIVEVASVIRANTPSDADPQPLGTADPGVSDESSRGDHVHEHGDLAGGSLHDVVTTSVAGFMSAADKVKLDSIAASGDDTVAGAGLTETGSTIDVVANADGSMVINANDIQVGILATDAQHGSRGGGSQHSVATGGAAGFMSAADKTKLDAIEAASDNTLGGAGLTKTGSTLNVIANADGSIIANANDIQVGVLASDAQHGSRGGGSQHSVATTSVAGFLSAADKTKLDAVEAAADNTLGGAGLTKTGSTLNVIANADGSIVANANDIQVGILASDAQHGTRGGGTQHSAVTTSTNGFMIAADKVKVNDLALDVKNYGAIGDGSADDTTAIVNAIAAAVAGGGVGQVYVPPGTYKTTSNIVMPSNLRLFGAGDNQSILKFDSGTNTAGDFLLVFTGARSHVIIEDLGFTTVDTANAADAGVFMGAACTDVTMRRCDFSYFSDYSFRCNTVSKRIHFVENKIHNIHAAALASGINPSYLEDSLICDNVIYDCGSGSPGSWAIYSNGTTRGNIFARNRVNNCTGGIKVGTGTHLGIIVSDNAIYGSTAAEDITIDGWDYGGVVSGNTCLRTTGGCSLSVNGCSSYNVQQNIIINTVASASPGAGHIQVTTSSSNGLIADNTLLGNDNSSGHEQIGIYLVSCDRVKVTGNKLKAFRTSMYCTAATRVQITDNYFAGDSGGNGSAITMESGSSKINIEGNTFAENFFFMFDCNASTVTFKNNTGEAGYFGRVTSPADSVLVENNVMTIAGTPELFSNTGTNVTVRGNGRIGVLLTELVTSITAHAGGGQGSATQLRALVNVIGTVASSGDSCILPDATTEIPPFIVENAGANATDLFPKAGYQINSAGANVAYSLPAGNSVQFYYNGSQWRTR